MSDDGYAKAFYELATIMDVGAQSRSPQDVWENDMLPVLREMFSAEAIKRFPDTVFIEEAQRRVNQGNWSPDRYMSKNQSNYVAKFDWLRNAVICANLASIKDGENHPALSALASYCDRLDSVTGHEPAPAIPINTAFYGRDPYEDHAPKPIEETP